MFQLSVQFQVGVITSMLDISDNELVLTSEEGERIGIVFGYSTIHTGVTVTQHNDYVIYIRNGWTRGFHTDHHLQA